MSKRIKIPASYIEDARADFEKVLANIEKTGGKIDFKFTKTVPADDRKATVIFTPVAWAKMIMLIKNFDKEVAWHGVTKRSEDETKDEYIISDIVVYPQTVTGASVDMDTEKYATWLMENDGDERFDHLRMQGHSHVNMATSPSGTDIQHQDDIIKMLGADDFYIFMIWNKSFVNTTMIYDLKKDSIFDGKDVIIKLGDESESLDEFYEKAKAMVVSRTYNYGYPRAAGAYDPALYNQNRGTAPVAPAPVARSTPAPTPATNRPVVTIGAGWRGKDNGIDEDDYYGHLYNC